MSLFYLVKRMSEWCLFVTSKYLLHSSFSKSQYSIPLYENLLDLYYSLHGYSLTSPDAAADHGGHLAGGAGGADDRVLRAGHLQHAQTPDREGSGGFRPAARRLEKLSALYRRHVQPLRQHVLHDVTRGEIGL